MNRHLLARIRKLEESVSNTPPPPQTFLEAMARSTARLRARFVSGGDLEETTEEARVRLQDETLIERWMSAHGIATGDDGDAARCKAKMLDFGERGG